MAANLHMGYVPMLGADDWMTQIQWEKNKWTYMAAGGAVLVLLLAAGMKKKRKRRAAASAAASKASSPTPKRPGSFSVSYQG